MKIDRQNYEKYVIDYLDGKLDKEQVRILETFLEFNPELREEFTGIEKICLIPDGTAFERKTSLLKTESDLDESIILQDFDMYCISNMENDITESEREILQAIIRDDPDREATYRLYQSTRLLPDASIIFSGKAKLKKRFIGIPNRIILPVAAAAAALLIVWQLFKEKGFESGKMDVTEQVQPEMKDDMGIPPSPVLEEQSTSAIRLISGEKESTETSVELQAPGTESHDALTSKSGIGADPVDVREKIRLERMRSIAIQHVMVPEADPVQMDNVHQVLKTPMHGDYPQPSNESAHDARLSLWMLADAGVRGLNSVSEDEYLLERKSDKNGNIRRFTLDTPVFGISAPLRKPEKSR
jgi:hypothetical protein